MTNRITTYRPRLRVTQESTSLLYFLLYDSLRPQWEARAEAQRRGYGSKDLNRSIKVTKSIIEEIHRVREEQGWPSLRSDETPSAQTASGQEASTRTKGSQTSSGSRAEGAAARAR